MCPYLDGNCGNHAQCVKCKGGTPMTERYIERLLAEEEVNDAD